MRNQLTDKAVKQIEERFELIEEAEHLLDVIAAEFKSDPMSVQCFDTRIVKRAIFVSERLRQLPKIGG